MAIQKIFAYNTGSLISGTTQVGDIAISEADVEYSANYGGLQWWGGPDETNGYVIAHTDPSGTHNGAAGGPAFLGFWRSTGLTDSAFLILCNSIPPRIGDTPFTNTSDASAWLTANGYWTSFTSITPTPTPTPTCTPFINNIVISNGSYTATNGTYVRNSASDAFTQVGGTGTIFFGGDAWYLNAGVFGNVARNTSTLGTGTWNPWAPGNSSGIIADYSYYYCVTPTPTPTPTPTNTETPTETPTNTPTLTPTPTSTDLSSVTTFTISGCTNLNVLVADLGPSSLAPGDVFNFTFTGGTPNGCYRIVEKTVATPTDGATPLLFYVNCAACQATLVTPTPTTTSTPTPSVTNTETPSVTPTLTQTPTSTDLSSITTYTISGCTNLNVLVVDLGPGFIVPGDVNYYTFTGATPSGCYSVIGKINAPIDDAFTTSFGTGGCNDCESTYITPTPTPTNTETPTGTPVAETPTPTETETPTPTPTPTGTPEGATPTPTLTQTPTPTDLSSITTYSISGCTNLNVLVVDLGPGDL